MVKSVNSDNDEHIAAESLLALVSSVGHKASTLPKASGTTTASLQHTNDDYSPRLLSSESSKTMGGSSSLTLGSIYTSRDSGLYVSNKVSEDELSQDQSRRSSTLSYDSVIPTGTDCSRRHSYPVTLDVKFSSTFNNKKLLPQVLMELLTDEEFHDSMSFLSDNMTFIIINTEKFSEVIMPTYFQETEFSNFLSTLVQFGFSQVGLNKDKFLFSHPLFTRNDWVSLRDIHCHSTTTTTNHSNHSNQSSRKRSNSSSCNDEQPKQQKVAKSYYSDKESLFAYQLRSSITEQLELSRQLKEEMIVCKMNDYSSWRMDTSKDHNPTVTKTTSHDNSLVSAMITANNQVHDVTKDVVAKAMDCLLHDTDHTISLIARREREINTRRVSFPFLQGTCLGEMDNIYF